MIGFLGVASPGPYAPFVAAFRQGLSETGYVEGQNLAIEYRWAEGHYDRLPALAADLVGREVDMIATTGGGSTARAAKGATSTIPIVFTTGGNPVESGLVTSLARPGGNLTGVSMIFTELMPKRFELISELVPQAAVIALLINPNNPCNEPIIRDVQKAAHAKGVQLQMLEAGAEGEFEPARIQIGHARAVIHKGARPTIRSSYRDRPESVESLLPDIRAPLTDGEPL